MLLVWGVNFVDDSYWVLLIFLVGVYLLYIMGEFCLLLVGLLVIIKLFLGVVVFFMMVGWFLFSVFV